MRRPLAEDLAHAPSVLIVRCTEYDGTKVHAAVRRAVDLVGGIGVVVRPGDRMLIKPNLLAGSPPDAAVRPIPGSSVPIRLVREAGGRPTVGDGPGIGDLRRVCQKAGLLAVLAEEGV